jgi:hypothetical protein
LFNVNFLAAWLSVREPTLAIQPDLAREKHTSVTYYFYGHKSKKLDKKEKKNSVAFSPRANYKERKRKYRNWKSERSPSISEMYALPNSAYSQLNALAEVLIQTDC